MTHENRLAREKSPYLLQHKNNPVDWWPWCEEAFETARRENRPVFLSIGYSTCHWCHVMEKESFEDEAVAALMNDTFVSIKVDREERPDLDNLYMTVCHLMTGQGGWPLTVLLTPEKKPFFAGTYIPKETRYGRAGMLDLVPKVNLMWQAQRAELDKSAEHVTAHLQAFMTGQMAREAEGEIGEAEMEKAYASLAERFDNHWGGFGEAPKFPTPHILLFLLRMWARHGKADGLAMVEKTLIAMRAGGMFDHVGFGFHRYSTDREWLVPHFEKMLYDQALLSLVYTEAYQITGNPAFRGTVKEVLTYVLRDMRSDTGGFYSAEDADSEGEEGKFYVFTTAEVEEILGPENAAVVQKAYGMTAEGNFLEEATGNRTGANILHLPKGLDDVAAELGIDEKYLAETLLHARQQLFAARNQRGRPLLDDKILTDWNGLMIAALARAGRALDQPDYTHAAEAAANFILHEMRDEDGRLLHRYREGEAGLSAHAEDYAFFLWGLVELYEATFDSTWLEAAAALAGDFLDRFRDAERGGFYFTASDAEQLLARSKEGQDAAIPSANSVAMLVFTKLARLLGVPDYEGYAEEVARAFYPDASQHPAGYTFMLCAVDLARGKSMEIVIAGEERDETWQAMRRAVDSRYLPGAVALATRPGLEKIAPWTAPLTPKDGRTTAYVCEERACKSPVTDTAALESLLKGSAS
ncbi:thioredoxin domain-containing protein [Oceanidesulfovibrio marinus]|uniref:Thioredoxin domain-containing protein n=1 Tax=Oceanidesulfovibrio marinus TaxID=370038 RepID=A0ABX6NIV0_9BACT|nr:thioredoxin domain-containing protein [Oceanidesulfovibrio marinus]QJT10560.1 thioredoxin domain-containing protein [Oceanidesulfovibrio marinus]